MQTYMNKLALAGLYAASLLWTGSAMAEDINVDENPVGIGVVADNPIDGYCSLIEAIENANADAATHGDCAAGAGDDSIILPANASFILDNHSVPTPFTTMNSGSGNLGLSGLPGISTTMTIEGHGSTIERTATTGANPTAKFRIITVTDAGAGGNLTLRHLTLQGGYTNGTTQTEPAYGGGVSNFGQLHVVNSTIADNTATYGGGGISNTGTLTIDYSTISGNTAMITGGGGVYHSGGSFIANHSTISGNTGNSGGGVIIVGSQTELNYTSIIKNHDTSFSAGGIVVDFGASVDLRNTLIADNTSNGGEPNCYNSSSLPTVSKFGTNLTNAEAGHGCGLTVKPDLTVGVIGTLGSLADNGGPTKTHALLLGSSAIDAALDVAGQNACGSGDNASDQRGFPRLLNGDGQNGAECDVGSFEYIPAGASFDYGDAPVPYPTLQVNSSAVHSIAANSPALGTAPDGDPDGQPSPDATGDLADDGVFFIAGNTLLIGVTNAVRFDVINSSAKIDAWVDLNGDKDWKDNFEQVLTSAPVVNGSQLLNIPIPPNATAGDTFMRVRISTTGGLAATGAASYGEVEDYKVTLASGVGQTGSQGPSGPPGADGAGGAQGPSGLPGANGVDGTDGVDGADGAQGPAGTQGGKGEKGESAMGGCSMAGQGNNDMGWLLLGSLGVLVVRKLKRHMCHDIM